jgi:hypothetical protein
MWVKVVAGTVLAGMCVAVPLAVIHPARVPAELPHAGEVTSTPYIFRVPVPGASTGVGFALPKGCGVNPWTRARLATDNIAGRRDHTSLRPGSQPGPKCRWPFR